MAVKHGKKAALYFEYYDFSSRHRSVSLQRSCGKADVSGFGMDAREWIAGQEEASLDMGGTFEAGAGLVDAIVDSQFGNVPPSNAVQAIYLPQGDGQGLFGYAVRGGLNEYQIPSDIEDAVRIGHRIDSSVGAERILIAQPKTTFAANNDTVTDTGETTTAGVVCYAIVFAGPATGALDLRIWHSADNITFGTLCEFTGLVGQGVQRNDPGVTTVNRYLKARLLGTWTGNVTLFMGVHRKRA